MNQPDIESTIKKHLHRVAPEADLKQLQPDDELGPTLDIDSMDIYTLMVAISEELHVDIPEEEYGKLISLQKIQEFLQQALIQ